MRTTTLLAAAVALFTSSSALAGEDGLGLNLDLGLSSAYVFRGFNVFQESGQMDVRGLLAPGIGWSIGDTGISVGYWGAFQTNGANSKALVEGALGAEQDLFAAWDMDLSDSLALSVGACAYIYPLATEAAAGANVPVYIEPGVGLSWSGPVDAGLFAAYFLGVQDHPGIRGISYLYVQPSVGKSLELSDAVGLDLGVSYGFKLWKGGNDGASNVHDVLVSAAVPISLPAGLYLSPNVNGGWTNLVGMDFTDGLVVFGGINVGVDL